MIGSNEIPSQTLLSSKAFYFQHACTLVVSSIALEKPFPVRHGFCLSRATTCFRPALVVVSLLAMLVHRRLLPCAAATFVLGDHSISWATKFVALYIYLVAGFIQGLTMLITSK